MVAATTMVEVWVLPIRWKWSFSKTLRVEARYDLLTHIIFPPESHCAILWQHVLDVSKRDLAIRLLQLQIAHIYDEGRRNDVADTLTHDSWHRHINVATTVISR